MRTILTTILTCFISIANIAQDNTTIKLIPNWKKGETKKYEIKNYSTVQWLVKHLCFESSSVLADSLVLRNRQLLVAEKR